MIFFCSIVISYLKIIITFNICANVVKIIM